MSKAAKFGVKGIGVGFCLALLMAGFAYYANSRHLIHDLSLIYLCLAPTSIALMATENATPSAAAVIIIVFALTNALIYGSAFYVIWWMWAGVLALRGAVRKL